MPNIIPFDQAKVPAHLAQRIASNAAFMAALPASGYPVLGVSGTRFMLKAEGKDTPILDPQTGAPVSQLPVILLGAKEVLDRNYYVEKYDPNQTEAKTADCFSRDGVRPDPSSTLKQHESCAGCPQNQFGTSLDANGNLGKGKACRETKVCAVFAQGGIYGLRIPPTSLKNFKHYVIEASKPRADAPRGVDLTTCVTILGFDPNFTYAVFTFGMGGYLTTEQQVKCDEFKDSQEVHDIIDLVPTVVPTIASQTAAAQAAVAQAPVQNLDPFAQTAGAETAPAKEKKTRQVKPKEQPAPVQAPAELMPDEPGGEDLAALANDLGLSL